MIIKRYSLKGVFVVFMLLSLFAGQVLETQPAHARIVVVDTYTIADEDVSSGDIISFDNETGTYSLSKVKNDEAVFGVVDTSPVLVFRTDTAKLPIVQNDTVLVNVTLQGGDIEIGDPIITSSVPGKGMRGDKNDSVIGYALESLNGTEAAETIIVDGEVLSIGSIAVALISDTSALLIAQGGTGSLPSDGSRDTPSVILTFRYVAAALFILGAFGFIFKNFGPNVAQGVKSVGRNPLAKSTIQSMVVFNLIIVFLISLVALFVSIVIIVLPF